MLKVGCASICYLLYGHTAQKGPCALAVPIHMYIFIKKGYYQTVFCLLIYNEYLSRLILTRCIIVHDINVKQFIHLFPDHTHLTSHFLMRMM